MCKTCIRWRTILAPCLILLTVLVSRPTRATEAAVAWVLWEKQPAWFGLTTRYVVVQASPTHDGCLQSLQSTYYAVLRKGETARWHDTQTFLCLPQGVRP